MKTALVTGLSRPGGSSPAEHLVKEGYQVFGPFAEDGRAEPQPRSIAHSADRVELSNGDLLDQRHRAAGPRGDLSYLPRVCPAAGCEC